MFSLKNQKPENGFRVPEGYFESFPGRLKIKIMSEEEPEKKKSVIRTLLLPQLAVAASFIGLMVIAYSGIRYVVNHQNFKQETGQFDVAGLSDYQHEDFDETMLHELYSEASNQEEVSNTSDENSTDAMVDYLLLKNADIESMLTEL